MPQRFEIITSSWKDMNTGPGSWFEMAPCMYVRERAPLLELGALRQMTTMQQAAMDM